MLYIYIYAALRWEERFFTYEIGTHGPNQSPR